MCRVINTGGIALAVLVQALLIFGCWCGNKFFIFKWYWIEEPSIIGLNLQKNGLLHFVWFNFLCLMSCISHLRASFGDPGSIPKDIEVPDYVDTVLLQTCDKCNMTWKP